MRRALKTPLTSRSLCTAAPEAHPACPPSRLLLSPIIATFKYLVFSSTIPHLIHSNGVIPQRSVRLKFMNGFTPFPPFLALTISFPLYHLYGMDFLASLHYL